MCRPQGRVLPGLCQNPRQSHPSTLFTRRRALPNRIVEEEEDPFSSGTDDDEVCGIDFVTLEPITGSECRRLREEEKLLNAHAAAVAAANKEQLEAEAEIATTTETIAKKKKKKSSSSRDNDGYDFFGRSRIALQNRNSIGEIDDTAGSSSSSSSSEEDVQPILPLRSPYRAVQEESKPSTAPTFLGGIRPSYRASPLYEEFQRQRDTSTAAKILFLDEGGEFRAALGAALLRHMLSRLRTSLDVTIECASLGPIDGRKLPSRDLQRTAAAMGISLNPAAASRQFQEVADAVRYDLILVMDRFDHQEVLREVSMLDAINPGGNYSGRVRVLGPFGMAARRATPSQIVQDIADPLYDMHTDSAAEQAALQNAAQELAFACRGLATYLLDLQAKCGEGLSLREALVLSLRCPLLAGELPSQRDRNSASFTGQFRVAQDDFFTVRAVNGQRRVVRRPSKPRGYWKDTENIENELRIWMKSHKLDRLPTQKELRAAGESSLAAAIDKLGGLAAFSKKMGVAMASRRPNGYWNDFENLGRALKAYMKPVEGYHQDATKIISNGATARNSIGSSASLALELLGQDKTSTDEGKMNEHAEEMTFWMPSAQELTDAGRGDLLRAIREHGGIVAVAKKLGLKVRRGSGWDEAKILQELRTFAAISTSKTSKLLPILIGDGQFLESMPTKEQLLAAGRGDLVSAVTKLGGFQYFRELYQSTRSIRKSSSAENSINSNNGSGTSRGTTESSIASFSKSSKNNVVDSSSSSSAEKMLVIHGRKLPIIEEVADQLQNWMSISNFPLKHRIPTRAELVTAGRDDLWSAVQRCGGGRRVAEYMGLEWVETRGRRKKSASDGEESDGSGGSGSDDPRSEIYMLDAYEEFVFI